MNELSKLVKGLSEIEKRIDSKPIPNCCTCKYRHGETYYDQERGMYFYGRNWCTKDKSLMDTGVYNSLKGKGHEFINNCQFYENGIE